MGRMAAKERSMSCLDGLTLQQFRNVLGQIYREKISLGKSSSASHFMMIGLPKVTIYQICQCIETRYTIKRKAESRRRALKMTEKNRNQLVKAVCSKAGVTSEKLAAQINVDRSLASRILKETDVTTYKRIRSYALQKPSVETESVERRELITLFLFRTAKGNGKGQT